MTLAIPMVDIPSGVTRVLGSLRAKEQPLPLESVQLRARVIDRVAEVTVEHVRENAGGASLKLTERQIARLERAYPVHVRSELPTA